MKNRLIRGLFEAILLLGGMVLTLAMVFALQLGFDNDPGWGRGRIILCALGVGLVLLGLGYHFRERLSAACRLIRQALQRSPAGRLGASLQAGLDSLWKSPFFLALKKCFAFVAGLPGVRHFRRLSQTQKAAVFLGVWVVFQLFLNTWFISAGKFEAWPETGTYYDDLANAFMHGQLNLLLEPSPELLQMDNPYDVIERIDMGVGHLHDATLFGGKYYLYWGPVPALMIIPLKWLSQATIMDQSIAFFFISATLILAALLLLELWRSFFPATPWWSVSVGILVLGFCNPFLYLFNRPGIYEGAIAACQCFLLAGLLCAIVGVKTRLRPGLLGLAGFFWALAVGSRVSLLVAISLMSLIVFVRVVQLKGGWKRCLQTWPELVVFTTPLAVTGILLAWYNFARFGDVFEFGMRYALTVVDMSARNFPSLAPGYILPNLFLYVFMPPDFLPQFPYLAAPWINELVFPFFIRLPKDYYLTEPVTGMLFNAPVVIFALWPLYKLLRSGWSWFAAGVEMEPVASKPYPSFREQAWFVWLLGVGFGGAFGTDLLFYYGVMRYQADWMLLLFILGMVALWQLYEACRKSGGRFFLMVGFLILALMTLCCGFFLAISGPEGRFAERNPELFYRLAKWFDWR